MLNRVQLIGRVGKPPELRTTEAGQKMARLSVATTDRWLDRNSGERKERTDWHQIAVMNETLAEITQKFVRKGSLVFLEGQLQARKFTDREGIERTIVEVVLGRVKATLIVLDRQEEPVA